MKTIARSLVVIFVALIAVPALAVSVTLTTAVQLLATTALIMGGTQHPLSVPPDSAQFVTGYMNQAVNNYIDPDGSPVPPNPTEYNRVAVIYPAEFAPVFGTTTFDDSVAVGTDNLSHCLGASVGGCNYNTDVGSTKPNPATDDFIVYGYSQSAVVASLVKNQLIEDEPESLDRTQFFLISNPMRPNGGILGRGFEGLTIPLIGITFYGPTQNSCPPAGCAADDTFVTPTVDVAQQYDFLGGDAPARLDPLAFANSLAAYALLHGDVPNRSIAPGGQVPADHTVVYQDTYGDTTYYMITAPRLPLLMLLEQAGVPGPLLALPDALLRVWIEDKYRRDLSPGEHVQFQLSPIGNPVVLVGNMLGAIPVGIDDTVQEATGTDLRPLGTANVYRPFGVGGPVYDKTTGLPAEDNIGIPTGGGAGQYDTQDSLQTLEGPDTGDGKPAIEADQLGNDVTLEGNETPEATKPEPFAKLRESLKFDPGNRPMGIRPDGDGPLRRIVNALTGQRPNADPDESQTEDPAA